MISQYLYINLLTFMTIYLRLFCQWLVAPLYSFTCYKLILNIKFIKVNTYTRDSKVNASYSLILEIICCWAEYSIKIPIWYLIGFSLYYIYSISFFSQRVYSLRAMPFTCCYNVKKYIGFLANCWTIWNSCWKFEWSE